MLKFMSRYLAVTAVFQGANRVELYGEAGAIIGEGLSGARPEGRITHNGQPVPFQPVNPFHLQLYDPETLVVVPPLLGPPGGV